MILAPITSELDTDFESHEYVVGNMALLQQAVSDRMYKNKHLAVVRELLANARDAHREAGIEGVPPEIVFPSHGDSHLRIKDYGPGVNLTRMKTSFTGYCASTKTGDNRQTGGFGLGCKTPFAVSQSFMVDTTSVDDDGVKRKRLWSHHKDARGLSSYSALTTEVVPDTTQTGTEIIIPASLNDRSKYVDAFQSICKWWTPIPHTPNEADRPEPEELEMWDERTCFHNRHGKDHRAIVDGIPYEVPWSLNIIGAVTLWFKTGEIPVTLTRDALDAAAEAVIVARIVELVEKVAAMEPPNLRWALKMSHLLKTTISWPGWDGNMSMAVPDGLRARHWKNPKTVRRYGRDRDTPERLTWINLLDAIDTPIVVNETTRVDTTVVAERAAKAGVDSVIYIHRYRKNIGEPEEAFLTWLKMLSTPWTEWEPTIKDTPAMAPKIRTKSPKYHYWETYSGRTWPWKKALPDRAIYALRVAHDPYLCDLGDGEIKRIDKLGGSQTSLDQKALLPIIVVRDSTKVLPGWITWKDYVRSQIKHCDRKLRDLVYCAPKSRKLQEFWSDLEPTVKKHPTHPLAFLWKLRQQWERSGSDRRQHRQWRGFFNLPTVDDDAFLDIDTLVPDSIVDLYSPTFRPRALLDMMPPPPAVVAAPPTPVESPTPNPVASETEAEQAA